VDRKGLTRGDANGSPVRFRDRREGGWLLANRLAHHRGAEGAVVLGIPRGGVVPALEIARALERPLDVLISRKLRDPDRPDSAIGAVAEDGEPYLMPRFASDSAVWKAYVEREIRQQRAEILRCQRLYRGGEPLRLPPAATAILVDDGVQTAATVIAAIDALRRQPIARLVFAVPVVALETLHPLERLVDEVVALTTPGLFWSIRGFYEDFTQLSDAEVCELLAEAHRDLPPVGKGA
jgi:putative phosphoribosyl transferase